MTEDEVKKAFRVAYDFVRSHQHPQHSGEYFRITVDEIMVALNQNKGNILLENLMTGVYMYLEKVAMEENKK